MLSCKHSTWLRLLKSKESHANHAPYRLEVSRRPTQLLDRLQRPKEQCPLFVIIVGNAIKARILATLGVEAPRVTSGEIQLFTSPSTVTDRRPLLVASADIPRKLAQSGKTFKCHDTSIRTPSLDGQHIDKPIDFASLIHHHILMPFSDVICVIAKDIGGWTKVVELMKAWVKLDKPTEHGPFACLVVVLHGEMSSHVPENLMKKLRCCFSDVRFHKVPNGADETQQYVKFKNKLLAIGKEGQLLKEKRKFLFSAHHLAGFLDLAGESANLERKQALDLIHLSRSGLSRIEDIEAHVARFVGSVDSFQALKSFAIPVISSCFILHQYPPGMHCKLYLRLLLQPWLINHLKSLRLGTFLDPYMKRAVRRCAVKQRWWLKRQNVFLINPLLWHWYGGSFPYSIKGF